MNNKTNLSIGLTVLLGFLLMSSVITAYPENETELEITTIGGGFGRLLSK
jgi:hypothetical protein